MIRTLIVEDNDLYRRALSGVLRTRFPDMVIAEACDGAEGMDHFRSLGPTLVIMDIHLPGENGLDVTRRMLSERSGVTVIVCTSDNLPEYRQAARAAGACGLLVKGGETLADLCRIVEQIRASS